MVRIRFARHGSKKRPFYWLVVTPSESPRDGRFLEKVGTYNPLLANKRVSVKENRIHHWISKGAQISDSARRVLGKENIVSPKPFKEGTKKSMPKKKAQERAAAQSA